MMRYPFFSENQLIIPAESSGNLCKIPGNNVLCRCSVCNLIAGCQPHVTLCKSSIIGRLFRLKIKIN